MNLQDLLDAKNEYTILELLKSHQKNSNTTLIIVTHDSYIAKQAEKTITLIKNVNH